MLSKHDYLKMNVMVSGHRLFKLETYDIAFIKRALEDILLELCETWHVRGFSGMASGVDLWFCQILQTLNKKYVACIPFEEQGDTMDEESRKLRHQLIEDADYAMHVKNRHMVEWCDLAIVVWDGNKGGTHNVVQQLVENKKGFIWINPVAKVVWKCLTEPEKGV